MGCVVSKPAEQVASEQRIPDPPSILEGPRDVPKNDGSVEAPQNVPKQDGSKESAKPSSTQKPTSSTKTCTAVERANVEGTIFKRGSEYCVFVGGNYVMKAAPYFPPIDIVRRNAKCMRESWERMEFTPPTYNGNAVIALPCVRLGCLMEGAMPDAKGVWDQKWIDDLNATVQAFQQEGIYVFLDAHQDALSPTNGGEGFPWWIAHYMQSTAPDNEWYVVTPNQPLQLAIPSFLETILRAMGVDLPRIRVLQDDPDPWHAFSIGSGMPPGKMNVGNVNMRLNTIDSHWGDVIVSAQVQTMANRLWNCHKNQEDRENVFQPWVDFVKHLCAVWQENTNVVCVEILNEPPLTGVPNIVTETWASRWHLFDFYMATLQELDNDDIKTPIALEDLFGACPGSNPSLSILQDAWISSAATAMLKDWAAKGQLIFSMHHYPGIAATVDFKESVELGLKQAQEWGGVPLWISEFHAWRAPTVANAVSVSIELGAAASTFWHYVDPGFTNTWGWYMYPWEFNIDDASRQLVYEEWVGEPKEKVMRVNWCRWNQYLKTIWDPEDPDFKPTVFGAMITGANGGQRCNLLELLPQETTPVIGLLPKSGSPPTSSTEAESSA